MHVREVNVTVVGNVGGDPVVRETPGGKVASFSVGSTPSRYDKVSGRWVDGRTTWFRVSCWRELGANVAESLRKGDRVMVSGRLSVDTYEAKEGGERTVVELVADHVGHELTFGTSRFTRVVRSASLTGADDAGHDARHDAGHDAADDAAQDGYGPATDEREEAPVPV